VLPIAPLGWEDKSKGGLSRLSIETSTLMRLCFLPLMFSRYVSGFSMD
jgi:hypothetical protein